MSAYLQVIFLAVLQGIAEFLPISSSGHLVLAKFAIQKLGITPAFPLEDITLDVALHVGTLGSILVVYRNDLWKILFQPRLLALLFVASIPAGLAGVFLGDLRTEVFSNRMMVGFCLLMTATLLMVAQQVERCRFDLTNLPFPVAMVIGLFQGFAALLPGISRAGSTICGALIAGVDRPSAAKFSFLLAIIAIGGAGMIKLKEALFESTAPVRWDLLATGIGVSFVVGVLSLELLLKLLNANRLVYFAIYCAAVGLLAIVWQIVSP
ncbi:MAG: undecaprenyl-diphosphate phosphatase [Planctomyces sp.]|jgi:undecaprenyl-diphosphatase|nr:undecaprenyl-diphosphate phosphatase [Planctomyces sp.]